MPDQPTPASPIPQDTDVYAIHGADPEVLAYAMARYSRSSLTMRESLAEISAQRAEQFLNTFYFQYGHRSIADLAHIPLAIERLSLLAAISLVDEPRWDGQERSTRYQDFHRSGWYTPAFEDPEAAAGAPVRSAAYTQSIEALFTAYTQVGDGMLEALKHTVPRPPEMKEDAYLRTLKARAFDVARYLLPLATNTSLGQITNARTLETQISRLLSSDFPEIRALGEKLRNAAAGEAWNVTHDAARVLLEEAASFDIVGAPGPEIPGPQTPACQAFHHRLSDTLLHPVKPAPTLVKYAAPNPYLIASRIDLRQAAAELMADQPIAPAPLVDLVEDPETLEHEIATSLLYPECHYSWRQLAHTVAALPPARLAEIIRLGTAHRGRHDELPRPFHAGGQSLRFDILMDIGGFRDMHRHRRCTQLIQPYTDLHGFEDPTCPGQPTLAEAGLANLYRDAMTAAQAAFRTFADSPLPGGPPATTPGGPSFPAPSERVGYSPGAPHLASEMWDKRAADTTGPPATTPGGPSFPAPPERVGYSPGAPHLASEMWDKRAAETTDPPATTPGGPSFPAPPERVGYSPGAPHLASEMWDKRAAETTDPPATTPGGPSFPAPSERVGYSRQSANPLTLTPATTTDPPATTPGGPSFPAPSERVGYSRQSANPLTPPPATTPGVPPATTPGGPSFPAPPERVGYSRQSANPLKPTPATTPGVPPSTRPSSSLTPNPEAAYLLPLGTRIRSLFKMDFAEALYIAELRSGVAGHFSYRRIAWEMYLAIARRHPTLAPLFRIEDVHQPIDLLKR